MIEAAPKPARFADPDRTADGRRRASVELAALETLWFNTGTLCNIECRHCYIESSPRNDRLALLTLEEVRGYLDEIAAQGLPTVEIGFTGGEPFVNPDLVGMLREVLERGFRALVLTNAMRPMQRPRVRAGLLSLRDELGGASGAGGQMGRLTFRVSLDHHTRELHELERGPGSWDSALRGMKWLAERGFQVHVAGRRRWGEEEGETRQGYAWLFAAEGVPVDAEEPSELVLFPEMDGAAEVPEVTVECWEILGKRPEEVMCARSRMVARRRGAPRPVVLACPLLPYDRGFELGASLADAAAAVKLSHPRCAQFCVLGGGRCGGPVPPR